MVGLRVILGVGIPFMVALMACALGVIWMLGIPGDPNADYAAGWQLGLFVILGFLLTYVVCCLARVLAWLMRWPIGWAIDRVTWLLSALFVIGMVVSGVMMA